MEINNKSNKKSRVLKWIGFGSLFSIALSSAIAFPIIQNNNKNYSLTLNHSTSTREGNENRINYYINQILNPNYYELSGSLKVYGKSSILGEDGVELTSSQRSLITINEAYEEGMFSLELKSSIYYQMRQYNVRSELAYVRPYETDSSYAMVGIRLFYGEGSNYYETIYEYQDTSLHGFKVSIEQTLLDYYSRLINANPYDYFQLKEEIGKVGQIGLYAKNISTSSFNLNNDKLKELRNKNFLVSIESTSPDNVDPSKLKVTYKIIYYDGNITSTSRTQEVYLGSFDVEQGVDDPQSKLNNFINSNTDWINNLNQYFEFNPPKEEDENNKKVYTVRDAYKAGYISLVTNYSIRSKLESAGITLEFRGPENEDPQNLNAFNYEFDSTTPIYRLFFTSYANTPLATTESVLIEGIAQENDFAQSQEEKKMSAFSEYLSSENLGFEDIFGFDMTENNPLSLSDYFMSNNGNNNVTFANGKYSIPFNLVFSLYEKYSSSENKISKQYPSPFKDFKFALINNSGTSKIELPSDYVYENESYDISKIANEILTAINDTNNGGYSKQLDSLSNSFQETIIKFNIFLGSSKDGTIYTNVAPLEINVVEYFESQDTYIKNLLNTITIEDKNVLIDVSVTNKYLFEQYIRERNWSSIFSSASIYNIQQTIPFPELLPQLSVNINMDYFDTFDGAKIEEIITKNSISIEISISIGTTSVQKVINKSFDDLGIKS
ncbi:MAG: hypothetical protein HDR43_00325 [Mycoplasma sp.]|nr:hypothetical protein [Mycoplasma sp.]